MAEWGLQWLLADALSWRWVLQVLLLSAGLSLASAIFFTSDPRSRRGLGVVAVVLLLVLPLVLLIWQPRWQIGVHQLLPLPWVDRLPNVPMVLLQGWLILVLTVSVHFLRQVRAVRAQLDQMPPFRDSASQLVCEQLAQRLGIATPALRVGKACCATSIGSQLVLVPRSFSSWAPAVQRAVLAHELVHLARRDDRWLVGLQLVWRWYLFCPWLAVLYNRFVRAIEESCDDQAAELVGGRAPYLNGLAAAALAEQTLSADRPTSNSLSYMAQSGLIQRTQRLLERNRFFEIQAGPLAAGTSLGLIALLLLTTFELVPAVKQIQAIPLATSPVLSAYSAQDPVETSWVVVRDVTNELAKDRDKSTSRIASFTPTTIYPGRALLNGIEGTVHVRYAVAADGSVVNARVQSATPKKLFNEAALRAVRQTVYAPDHATGLPGASVTLEKQFVFRMRTADRNHERVGGDQR